MANFTQRTVNTFVKGLVTESGELTFPENASTDELNCELFRDGSRRRRKAIKLEEGGSNSSFTVSGSTNINFGEWINVGSNPDKQYLIVQVGPSLQFYNKGSIPYSSQENPNSVDLTPYAIEGSTGAANARCDFASILGNLVVVSKLTEPVYITEMPDGTFKVVRIKCRVRDFKWLGNRSSYGEPLATADVPDERKYDTQNCGWAGEGGGAALTTYIAAESEYPALTHPWYSGKNSSGVFSVAEWKKVYSGSSIMGNGHYILDLFDKDRETVSSIPTLRDRLIELINEFGDALTGGSFELNTSIKSGVSIVDTQPETSRFTTVTSFASRVFFAGLSSAENTGKVYFSQIMQDMSNVGEFLQKNDPTSEDISDLLDDDGGEIVIPDATSILKLYSFRNSIFVFADNGVWQISGVDSYFSPSGYSVSRVTEIGMLTSQSFVPAEGVPFWWSKNGIHTMSFDEYNNASEENLSISTIQSFWDDIDSTSKQRVRTAYDKVNKKVVWMFPENGESIKNKNNRAIVLDISLQAFYPWKVEDAGENSDYILGLQYFDGFGSSSVTFNVVVNGDSVITGSDTIVSTQDSPLINTEIDVVFFVRDTSESKMTFALMNGSDFFDWGEANYLSFAETGFDFMEDLMLQKTAPYILLYLRETETGWVGSEEEGYNPINDSSLLVSGYWDFKKIPSSTPQQAYKRNYLILPDSTRLSNFDSRESVVSARLKMRGRGRVLKIRLESEQGKDFIYLGHGLIGDVSNRL